MVKVKNNRTMSILTFTRILYLEQQSNILRCFYSLKFEKSLCSNELSSWIFRSKRIVYTAKKVQ